MHGTVTRLGEFTRSVPGICHMFRRLGPLTAALGRKSGEEGRIGVTRADDCFPSTIQYVCPRIITAASGNASGSCRQRGGKKGMNLGIIRAFPR